jgi:S-adenosylmethionine synthetase
VEDKAIESAIKSVFDMTPSGIIKTLDLRRPIYRATAAYGHFGRSEFSWEQTDQISALQSAVADIKAVA